ncbi:MAG: hypothetical protein ACKVS8_07480 [Phycisphaerales bacterium]
MPDDRTSEFFVGYLAKAPAGIARRARVAVALLLVAALAVAGVATVSQNPPVPSVWQSELTTLEGVLVCDPYPRLVVREPGAAGTRHVLLTAQGKFGLLDPADYCGGDITKPWPDPERDALVAKITGLAGATVRVSGTILRRERGEMMEVLGVEGLASAPPVPSTLYAAADSGVDADLVGEIVDPKCFYGAMKPGEGKTHKACAVRCVAGGITPVLVVRSADRPDRCIVLTTAAGEPINAHVLAVVGERVRVQGRAVRVAEFEPDGGPIEFLRVERISRASGSVVYPK